MMRTSDQTRILEGRIADLELVNEHYKTAVENSGYAVWDGYGGPHLFDKKRGEPILAP